MNADTIRPTLLSVVNLGDNQLLTVAFSEPVEPASANLASNYTLNNSAIVQSASVSDDGASVALTTTPLAFNLSYTLTVNSVRDRAQTPNTIVANSQKTFTLTYRESFAGKTADRDFARAVAGRYGCDPRALPIRIRPGSILYAARAGMQGWGSRGGREESRRFC